MGVSAASVTSNRRRSTWPRPAGRSGAGAISCACQPRSASSAMDSGRDGHARRGCSSAREPRSSGRARRRPSTEAARRRRPDRLALARLAGCATAVRSRPSAVLMAIWNWSTLRERISAASGSETSVVAGGARGGEPAGEDRHDGRRVASVERAHRFLHRRVDRAASRAAASGGSGRPSALNTAGRDGVDAGEEVRLLAAGRRAGPDALVVAVDRARGERQSPAVLRALKAEAGAREVVERIAEPRAVLPRIDARPSSPRPRACRR